MKRKGGGTVWKYKARNGERLWRYQFDGDPIDGRRCRFTRAGFSTRTEALNALRDATKSYVDSKTLPIHHALGAANITILENLDLRAVPAGCYDLIALPLRLAGADGSLVRAVLIDRAG